MGNAALRGPAVEERLTQPRRLVRQLSDLDPDRLRRLIRSGDLAPCFDAADEDGRAVECPICFHFYPSLNRSKCCGKGICTECFLQLMPSKASRAVHCPFCKTAAYAVEYRGARTLSEKKLQREVSFQPRDSDQHTASYYLIFASKTFILNFLQEEQSVHEGATRIHSKNAGRHILLP
ncbi:E3 ubiquitin-protein ligase GW2-like isoform X1 [Triticum urartu]|uniref:E3 ubiquitin-protein ligase GW2-like isoform X1 n=1 Tax=Triticum urartu TaxID=4572 RepID=UPI001E21398A|nr:E3 ubiquitin-protein ligase GW2-like isoform X1 [Triticum urartu]